MTVETQTNAAAPTGPAAAAGNAPAPTGETPPQPNTPAAPTDKVSLMGDGSVGEKKDAGKEQGQTSGENKTTPEAGAELDVKVPDGSNIDPVLLDGLKPVFKEAGLTSEGATKIVAKYAELQAGAEKALIAQVEKTNDEWAKQLRSDPTVGDFTAFKTNIDRALEFSGMKAEVTAEIHRYGLDNNPVLAKFMAKVGQGLAEGQSSVKPQAGGPPVDNEKAILKARYNNSQV